MDKFDIVADNYENDWRELAKELYKAGLKRGYKKAKSVPRWIPCSERLPFAEYGESPNVYCYCHDVERGGRWAEMLYFNGGVWCKPTGETFDYKVLAWYPLPKKPYREEGEQDD